MTLKQVFSGCDATTPQEERKTPYGEIVYLRSALDFSSKAHQAGNKRDEVLEENLLDVRRILKNTTGGGAPPVAPGAQPQAPKKGLINL